MDRHALPLDDHSWTLDADTPWAASAARAATASNGILLYGEPGAGQDELAWRVTAQLGAKSGVLELACPPDATTSEALSELATHPPPPGLVLFIPDIDAFSGPDLEVVSRLVLRHRSVVVAVADDPQGAPEAPLGRYFRLERLRVRELTEPQAVQYLENGLKGPLSERATYAIWDSATGNRTLMRMIAADWREVDYLVPVDGIWVIRGSSPPAGPRLLRHWKQRLSEYAPEIRTVFELLALGTELPLNVVLQICGAAAVDEIHDLGYLHLRASTSREASLRGAINAKGIAQQVPPGRSRELLDRVIDYVDGIGMQRPAGLVPWRLHCGLPIVPQRFLVGANHLLWSVAPGEALKLLKHVPADFEPERTNGLRIAALLAAGQFVDAWTLASNLKLSVGNSSGDVTAMVSAAELIGASWEGDYRPILSAGTKQPQLPNGLGWLWQQMTHEAMVLGGRVHDGLKEARELMYTLEQSDGPPFLLQRCRLGLFEVECLAGEWSRAAATLAGGWNAESGAPGEGKTGTLYTAIGYTLTNDFKTAAILLRREVPQLKALGRHDLMPLAYALYALSLARTGDRAGALEALASVELTRGRQGNGTWRSRWVAGFFWAEASGYLGRVDAAVEWLMDFAAIDHELGNTSQELLTLSRAVQWGHVAALPLMAEAAAKADGRFAEACVWVVRGMDKRDPQELEYGLLLLRAIGQHPFADYVTRELEALNGPCPNDSSIEVAAPADFPTGTADRLRGAIKSLTPRQRAIVNHVVADRSNGEIASVMGVSVRTVESHLYQAYSKLNVANRAELREVLRDWDRKSLS